MVLPIVIIWHSVRWISGALNEHYLKCWALNRALNAEKTMDAQRTKSKFYEHWVISPTRHRLLYGACCFGKPTVSALNFLMNYILLEIDEFCMLELLGATHRKNCTNGHYAPGRPPTLGHGGCPKQPFCAILFYVLPQVTESCKTCLYGSIEV